MVLIHWSWGLVTVCLCLCLPYLALVLLPGDGLQNSVKPVHSLIPLSFSLSVSVWLLSDYSFSPPATLTFPPPPPPSPASPIHSSLYFPLLQSLHLVLFLFLCTTTPFPPLSILSLSSRVSAVLNGHGETCLHAYIYMNDVNLMQWKII